MSKSEPELECVVREYREAMGLSQQALGDAVGVSRQAINGIEGGKQVPSTAISLRLAHVLGCSVENLFRMGPAEGLEVRLAPLLPGLTGAGVPGDRVVMGEVDGELVAHRLPVDPGMIADGVVASASGPTGRVSSLLDPEHIRRNVIVTGCAPILGTLAQRVGNRFTDARATWLPASSRRSLEMLQSGLVHVAGLHYSTAKGRASDGLAMLRGRFRGRRTLVVNLTRWRQGFVVAKGNPKGIESAADLAGRPIRFALRESGAAAHDLITRLLVADGVQDVVLTGPTATGHADVAQLVRLGVADVGVAIESVALAAGLDFVPLTEERFDLVIPASAAADGPAGRLLEALGDPVFRAEMQHIPGYDGGLTGKVTTLEAA